MNNFEMRRAMLATLGGGLLLSTVPACITQPQGFPPPQRAPLRPSLPVPTKEKAQELITAIQPQVEQCRLQRVGGREFRQEGVNHFALRTPDDNLNVTVWLIERADRLMFQIYYQSPPWANTTGAANSIAGVVVAFYDSTGTEIGQGTTHDDGLAELDLPLGTTAPYRVRIVSSDAIRFKFPNESRNMDERSNQLSSTPLK